MLSSFDRRILFSAKSTHKTSTEDQSSSLEASQCPEDVAPRDIQLFSTNERVKHHTPSGEKLFSNSLGQIVWVGGKFGDGEQRPTPLTTLA